MKRLLLSCLSLFVIGMSFSFAVTFFPSVDLDNEDKEIKYMNIIDTALDAYTKKYSEEKLNERFPIIHERIENALDRSGLSDDIIFFLEYLDRYILDRMEDHPEEEDNSTTTSSSTSSSSSTSTSISSTNANEIDPSDYDEGEKNITIGGVSGPVIKFEVTADLEDIQVNEFAIVASSDTLGDVVSKIYVYDEDGDLIDSDTVRDDRGEFTEEIILEEGDNTFYVALLPKERDDIDYDEEFTFSMHITDAESTTNGNDVSTIIVKNTDDIVSIAAATFAGEGIQLLNSYNHWFVDSKMYNQARTDLAIISVDFGNTYENDDIVLETLEFTLDDGTIAGDVHTTLELKRIDNQSDPISIDSKNGDQVIFNLSDLGNKQQVQAGSTAVFLVTGYPLLTSTESEYIRVELEPNTTQQGVITYSTEGNNGLITTKGHPYIGKVVISN